MAGLKFRYPPESYLPLIKVKLTPSSRSAMLKRWTQAVLCAPLLPQPFNLDSQFLPAAESFGLARDPKEYALIPVFAFALALPPGISSILPLILIPVVFYFLLMRPNQQKQKQWGEMLANLKSGDRVTTTGGIKGVVIALRDDSLHIRVAPDNIKLEIARTAIASVTTEEEKK